MKELDKIADEILPDDLKSSKLKVRDKWRIAVTLIVDDYSYEEEYGKIDYSKDTKDPVYHKRRRPLSTYLREQTWT